MENEHNRKYCYWHSRSQYLHDNSITANKIRLGRLLIISMKKVLIISPEQIYNDIKKKGFYDKEPSIPEKLCLIHSEISEALEAHRNNIPKDESGWIGEELADAVIRIFDMCGWLDIDIIHEIEKKTIFNRERTYKHGKQY